MNLSDFDGHQCVYVMSAGDRLHKIGISTNVRARLASIQGANAEDVEARVIARSDRAGEVERLAHDLLKAHRLRGEWFNVDLATADEAMCAAWEAVHGYPIFMGDWYEWHDPFESRKRLRPHVCFVPDGTASQSVKKAKEKS